MDPQEFEQRKLANERERVAIERARFEHEKIKAARDERFVNRHLGATIGAIATVVGAFFVAYQVRTNANLAASQQQTSERVRAQEVALANEREERRLNLEVANFIANYRGQFLRDEGENKKLREVIIQAFSGPARDKVSQLFRGPTGEVASTVAGPVREFEFYDSDDDCAAERQVENEYCVKDAHTLDRFEVIQTTANCGSGITSQKAVSARCVKVAALVKGCGYGIVRDCKGRGWVGYRIVLFANMPPPP
jgi:hypothetical protein